MVKADAYGHGIVEVTDVLARPGGRLVFRRLRRSSRGFGERTERPTLVIGPPLKAMDRDVYVGASRRPAVSNADEAMQLADAGPVLCVDTGMQRFACPPERLEGDRRRGDHRRRIHTRRRSSRRCGSTS